MSTPQDKDDLQWFIGLINYLATYIMHFADRVAPLRELLKKDVPFLWQEDHQCTLEYINRPTQAAYSNTERETLAIVCGIQTFHTYLFGTPFVVITDHKPLLMTRKKPLKSAPTCLQRLLIKIQGYDFQLVYRPGSQMIIADTLSRIPNPGENAEIPLDVTVDGILTDEKDERLHKMYLINFSTGKQVQLRSVYWPNIHKDIEKMVRSCAASRRIRCNIDNNLWLPMTCHPHRGQR